MPKSNFFVMVAQAAFANPFGEGRMELDFRLAGSPPGTPHAYAVDEVIARVSSEVSRLEAAGKADVRAYGGEERGLMRTVLLFDVFHRFLEPLDALILAQAESGDKPCRAPFAEDALSLLGKRGFTDEEAFRYLAIFYQIRRAFYFINNGLAGRCESMRNLRMRLWDSIFTQDIEWYDSCLWDRMEDFSTLLLGETGTGKGAAAAAVGRSGYIPFDPAGGCFSESFTRNFIQINLSQFPASLIESELFGHRKGSFTGAIDNYDGVFSRCAPHGSIFLDEVGDVSIPIQIKLLQILQERVFSPVGSHEKLRFNGRVIAATNRPINELRREGRFRDDFFYRISSDIITVPTLRQRIGEDGSELELMVGYLLTRITGRQDSGLTGPVMEVLRRDLPAGYGWPGNVRELEQAVRRVLVNRRYEGDVRTDYADEAQELAASMSEGVIPAEELTAGYCKMLYNRFGTYEEVARRTRLDRRTVKRYIGLGRDTGI